ncbi:bifunctional prephenate dehydrogenase/3-phosphoshikimate 1-carboxyvinyltransferase [Psychrobacter sp. AOP22-C1-22]|uniref:bifunctional prephenate dehydrogenase/3-phosphoshikimate 1-carboxyvinyltransferase n=1 Tax=unclassified Psychrobacter TaxID=196806 RepID=UPI00178871AB|nr:bifunctional prephenate dehydrogenase/3-phosphoshikimate 1-carboxyvinyltransferase [Psychrobacter sp. FME6]MBE0406469.1 bifunctional prephenate dehydrogenase/3-phosphoshikimate 1-carboxyvinyltransferase [Psychrobacter sp. FME6]
MQKINQAASHQTAAAPNLSTLPPLFDQVCVIGLGLIGASLAQAIKDNGLSRRLVAVDRHAPSIEEAIQQGLLDAGSSELSKVVSGSDLIVIAVPVQAVQTVFADIKTAMDSGQLATDCIITDVCSTKVNIIDAAKAVFSSLPVGLVPAHPIAGAENSGYHARRANLFVNHSVIICELPTTKQTAITKLRQLWEAAGATVMPMAADHHDSILAHTSHLPHLLAFNLVEQLASHDDNLDMFRYAAGGFRDFTRIAASDPKMWHDIFFANQDAIVSALDEYGVYLQTMRQLIIDKDSTALMGLLGRAQAARRHFGHMLASTPYTDTSAMSASYLISPSNTVSGTITIPGDKSISHRSIMLGSLATGVTKVTGFLEGEDALATLQAFRDMGVTIEGPDKGRLTIHGVGMNGLKPSKTPLYMGNSGTSMRLLAGILAAQSFDSVMTGDTSLNKRPMERVAAPLREMGAVIQSTGHSGTAPLSITGRDNVGKPLQGVEYDMPVASAQIKSCLLLAGLWAEGTTTVTQPEVSRDHTERMLSAFGYPVTVDGNRISVDGGGTLTGGDIAVPADISSAAFFMVAAAISHGSELTLKQVGINPTRTGIIDILKLMQADITLSNKTYVGEEPVADITIRSSNLVGIKIPEMLVPLAIDEFPVLFIAASCAQGRTVLTGAKELRVKESDRIAVMAEGLQALGVDCTVTDDGLIIEGQGSHGQMSKVIGGQVDNSTPVFGGGHITSHHDHRIAMSFAVASLRASEQITIEGIETVNTSFPGFAELANQIGMAIEVDNGAV